MHVKFNDSEERYNISKYRVTKDFVMIEGKGLPDNTSGFGIYQGRNLISDFSDYTKKYNVLTQAEGVLFLTNGEEVETEENCVEKYIRIPAAEDIHEDVDPLTNEELTECVADLMYEMSMSQLGL